MGENEQMKKITKTLTAMLIILALALPNYACVKNEVNHTVSKKNVYHNVSKDNEKEVKDAITLGIIPEDFTDSYKKSVTEKKTCQILLNCIEKYSGKKNEIWRKKVASAQSIPITRQKLAELIYQGANAMGMNLHIAEKSYTRYFSVEKIDKKFVSAWVKKYGYSSEYANRLSCSYMDLADILQEEFKEGSEITIEAVLFSTIFGDNVTSRKVMELTEDYHFRPQDKATCLEASLAVYRMYQGMERKPEYVSLNQVGKNTIDPSLLTKVSRLPEVSNHKLPAWKGVSISDKGSASDGCLFSNLDRNFHEAKIKYLADQGFNMVRVMLSFSTLGFPDYPAGKVNEHELEELDKLIEWGIQYGVHINLCMYGKPEKSNQWPDEIQTGDLFTNKTEQNKVKDYWKMLSKRYADIPNKYLSFNLMNEPEVENDEAYTKVFTPIVKAIWTECPDRVIIADIDGNRSTGEGLAQMGVALSYHFYEPCLLTYNGLDFFSKEYPTVKEPKWPIVYLPSVLNDERPAVNIEGDFEKGSVSIFVHDVNADSKSVLTILANGVVVYEKEIKGNVTNTGNITSVQKEFTAEIPEGTKNIKLKVNEGGTIRLASISIKQKRKTTTAYGHDLLCEDYAAKVANLIYADERISNKEKDQAVDWNYYYNKVFLQKIKLANKYHVGFMVGEFAPFGKLLSKNLLLPYMDMLLGGFTKEGIGWSNGGFIGEMYTTNFYPFKGEYHFKKDSSTGLYYNEELLETYRKYLQ